MTAIARRESLLDYWTRFYAERPSTVDAAMEIVVARGFDRGEADRAREKALELALFGGALPGCDVGVSPAFMALQRVPRGRA